MAFDWLVAKLSKSQDEMRKIFKLLNVNNISVEGVGNIVVYHEYQFVIIDKNVIMRNTFADPPTQTVAFFGLRSVIRDGIKKLIEDFKNKKTSNYFEKIKKENQ